MREIGTDTERRPAGKVRIGIALAAIALVLLVSLVILKPAMPDRITLLTGIEGSAYHALGQRYAVELERRGLEAEVVVTRGSLDNIERLVSGDGDAVAFAPSTVARLTGPEAESADLVALGSVDFDPLWLFYRSELEIDEIRELTGLVVITGGAGTVGDYVARKMFEQNGLTDQVELRPITPRVLDSLADRLLAGSIDAAFLSGSPDSPVVKSLLGRDGVSFLSADRAEAYAARIAGLTTLTAPEGVFDLARNVPSEEALLLSTTTNLVALDSIHPAVAPVLLDVASSLTDETSYFSSKLAFPSEQNLAYPLDQSAKRYYQQGKVGLSKYLPYRVTRFLNHLGFVVLPLLALTVLLLKAVPAALRIWGNLRLVRLFKRLEAVEKGEAMGADRSKLLDDLDQIDRESAGIFVPRSLVHDYIDFRQFLHDMRERAERGP